MGVSQFRFILKTVENEGEIVDMIAIVPVYLMHVFKMKRCSVLLMSPLVLMLMLLLLLTTYLTYPVVWLTVGAPL